MQSLQAFFVYVLRKKSLSLESVKLTVKVFKELIKTKVGPNNN